MRSRKWRESWKRDREEEVVLSAVQEEVLSDSKREKKEESQCSEEAKETNSKNDLEMEGQWQRGGGAWRFGFSVQGEG